MCSYPLCYLYFSDTMDLLFLTILISFITSSGTKIHHRVSSTTSIAPPLMQHIARESGGITQQDHPLNHQEKVENLTNDYPFVVNQPLFRHNMSRLFNLTGILFECFQSLDPPKHCTDFDILLFRDISIGDVVDIACNFNKSKLSFFSNVTLQDQSIISIEYNSFDAIQICTLVIFIFGFVANSITSLMIIRSPKLHKPFYVSVLFIALSDLFCILQLLVRYGLHIMLGFCQFQSIYKLLEMIKYSTKLNASLNVMILSTVRFVMFVYPLRSRIFLTNRKVCLAAGMSLALSVTYGFLIVSFIWNAARTNLKIIFIADDIGLLLCFVLINISFFVIRIKTASASRVAKDLKTRMTLVMLCILSLNAVNALSTILTTLMSFETGFQTDSPKNKYLLKVPDTHANRVFIDRIVYLIFHLVNPFIYFLSLPHMYKKVLSKSCNAE